MKVWVDGEKCIGCGICVDICPDYFRLRDDGLAEAIAQNSKNDDCIKEAAESCPSGAIILKD